MIAAAWQQARHLLCVRLDTLGDVLMTTPAIRALKESCTGRRITLLTSPVGAAIAERIPEIDEVLVYDAPWMKATAPRVNSRPEYAIAARLREARFDGAVIFTVYSQNPLPAAFLCYLADIPLRLAHCHENAYQLLTDWIVDPEPQETMRHEVRRQLDLVAAINCRTADERLSICVREAARDRVERRLGDMGVDQCRPWLVIHAGATAPSRRYPPEYYARVVHQLVTKHDFQAIFTGVAEEREWIEPIRRQAEAPSHSLVGKLNLDELTALLERAPVLLSNNTGPVHIAAALGTPVVDLYALTNPQHTPWQTPNRVLFHDVPCKNCYKSVCPQGHHACLRGVEPETVVGAVLEVVMRNDESKRGTSHVHAGN